MDIKKIIRKVFNKSGYDIVRITPEIIARKHSACVYDYQEEAGKIIERIRPYTMLSYESLITLYQQVRWSELNFIPGDFVECGIWKGGAVGLMAQTNLFFGKNERHIHCFDIFDNICEPDPKIDGEWAIQQASILSGRPPESFTGALKPVKNIYASHGGACTLEEVKMLIENKIGYPKEYLHYYKGWFQDTLPVNSRSIKEIALLRIDADWYASTKICLEYLYDKVVPGGFIIIDDYGTYDGCRKAVDEWITARGKKVFLHHASKDTRYWIKPA